jgi:hypothetical protein
MVVVLVVAGDDELLEHRIEKGENRKREKIEV